MAHSSATIVGICQLKGGVGATTVAAGLASCWARSGKRVALIDFDDVNPHLTAWSGAEAGVRAAVSRALRLGKIENLQSMTAAVLGYGEALKVIPQPNAYHESFQYKADVLEGAASATEFVQALFDSAAREFDLLIVDLGGSWGMATFTALPRCNNVLLIVDDDVVSVNRSLESLRRLSAESSDEREFDFSRWTVVLNGYTGNVVEPLALLTRLRETSLFPESTQVLTVPFSVPGRGWGSAGVSFYDVADQRSREGIEGVCDSLLPGRVATHAAKSFNLFRLLRSAVEHSK